MIHGSLLLKLGAGDGDVALQGPILVAVIRRDRPLPGQVVHQAGDAQEKQEENEHDVEHD